MDGGGEGACFRSARLNTIGGVFLENLRIRHERGDTHDVYATLPSPVWLLLGVSSSGAVDWSTGVIKRASRHRHLTRR